MRAIAAYAVLAGVACGLATVAIAQPHPPDDDYLAVVRSYRDGDAEAAVRAFAALRERVSTGFTAFTARVIAEDDPRHPAGPGAAADFVTAAAAAHTEVALRPRVPASADVIDLHLSIAASIVEDGVPAIPVRTGPVRPKPTVGHHVTPEFKRLWYIAVIAAMQRSGRIDRAGVLIQKARELFPEDAEILLQSGIADEMRTTQRLVPVDANERLAALARAETDLRASLAIAPDQVEATLRLGRVLEQQRRIPEARALLTTVAKTGDARQVYLAALFLGRLEDEAGQPAAAAEWYDKASARIPSGQAARIAASELRHRAGDRHQAIADLQSAIGSKETDDPWWMYFYGEHWRLDPLLDSLRAMGRS